MPRCIISTSPEERSSRRYLPRRPSPATVLPSSRLAKFSGKGQRKSGRRASTFLNRAPSIAGGTGDVALRVVAAGGAKTAATVLDPNRDMLAVGRQRAAEQAFDQAVSFVEGNAEALPFPDRSFDAYSIAFGIRNVPRIDVAL